MVSMFARYGAPGRFQIRKFRQGQMGWKFPVRAALMACAVGAVVLTSTPALAQRQTAQAEADAKADAIADARDAPLTARYQSLSDQLNRTINAPQCFDKDIIDGLKTQANTLAGELASLAGVYATAPFNTSSSPAINEKHFRLLQGYSDQIKRLASYLDLKICPPEQNSEPERVELSMYLIKNDGEVRATEFLAATGQQTNQFVDKKWGRRPGGPS